MIKQYPDTLIVTTGPGSVQDSEGNWITDGTATTTKAYMCRYEPNTGNRTIAGDDGNMIDYSGTLFLKTADTFKIGAALTINRQNGQTINGNVKNAETAQISARIWL